MLVALPMSAQKVSVEAKIDSTVIFIGQQTGFHLGVTVKDGQKVQFPQYQPLDNIIPGIEVVEIPRNLMTDIFVYQLTIPSLRLKTRSITFLR